VSNAPHSLMPEQQRSSRLGVARRDAMVLAILITAVLLLVWNGSTFFERLRLAGPEFGREAQIASTALMLNVALILFGWRRYVDLLHEAEMRADGELRAAVLASTDTITGLNNRKGFADRAEALSAAAAGRGEELVVMSIQIHRFKAINDQHGYDIGDSLLRTLARSLTDLLGADAVVARLGGDEFAAALALDSADLRIGRSPAPSSWTSAQCRSGLLPELPWPSQRTSAYPTFCAAPTSQ
jgi:GGDEF domain-containing protein